MTEMIDKAKLLSFLERETDRWVKKSDIVEQILNKMQDNNVPDDSIAIQQLAFKGLKIIDRALIMERLRDMVLKWDGSSDLDKLDVSDIDRAADALVCITCAEDTSGLSDEDILKLFG